MLRSWPLLRKWTEMDALFGYHIFLGFPLLIVIPGLKSYNNEAFTALVMTRQTASLLYSSSFSPFPKMSPWDVLISYVLSKWQRRHKNMNYNLKNKNRQKTNLPGIKQTNKWTGKILVTAERLSNLLWNKLSWSRIDFPSTPCSVYDAQSTVLLDSL